MRAAGNIAFLGEALYREFDGVQRLNKEGIDVGLINKPPLKMADEEMMAKIGKSPIVNPQRSCGGLWEQFSDRRIDPVGIMASVKELMKF